MPTLNTFIKAGTKFLPDVISPRAQAVLDYAMVGSFVGGAIWFWSRNKRAAVAALLCGGTKLALTLLTDYPGSMRRVIDLHTRRELDLGLAAIVATTPELLALEKPHRRFFTAEGALLTIASRLSQVPASHSNSSRLRRGA